MRYRRDQQYSGGVGRLDPHQLHRLGHRQLAAPMRALEGRAPQRLGQQIKAQRHAQQALGLAVKHGDVFITLSRRDQFPGRIQLTDNIGPADLTGHLLFKPPALLAKYPRRPRVGASAQQQRLGETVEFFTGHIVRIDEEAPQTVQALLLILEALLQSGKTFVDQQLKALAHLLLIEVRSRPGDDCRQCATCQ